MPLGAFTRILAAIAGALAAELTDQLPDMIGILGRRGQIRMGDS
jgi:hypothetical protein